MKINKWILLFASAINVTLSISQQSFFKTFGDAQTGFVIHAAFESSDSNFHITASKVTNNGINGYYLLLDNQGNKLKELDLGTEIYPMAITEYNKTIFIAGNEAYATEKFFKFDLKGNLILDTFYRVNTGEGQLNTNNLCVNKKENTVLMRGFAASIFGKPRGLSFINIDTSGKRNWYTYFGDSMNTYASGEVFWNPDSNNYTAVTTCYQTQSAYLIKIDSVGKFISKKSLSISPINPPECQISRLKSGGFIMLKLAKDPKSRFANIFVFGIHLSPEGDSLSAVSLGVKNSSIYYGIKFNECINGNLIGGDSKRCILTSNKFKETWSRLLVELDTFGFVQMQSMKQSIDGGYFTVGNSTNGFGKLLVIKLNSKRELLWSKEIFNDRYKTVTVYPNPANQYLYIDCNEKDVEVELYNRIRLLTLNRK
ncbi:MAG: hypothetical protein WC760_07175 [Bacteroidia bacterium]|jgi:hypothetical protein